MKFVWVEQNLAHLANHGIGPDLAEAIFHAPDQRAAPSSQGKGRNILEASIEGRLYRLVFTRVGPEEIFINIGFPVRWRT